MYSMKIWGESALSGRLTNSWVAAVQSTKPDFLRGRGIRWRAAMGQSLVIGDKGSQDVFFGDEKLISATTLLGAAGEHYIMCQLLRRGLIAALAPVGVPNSDIVVTDAIGEKLCAIQVKTRTEKGSDGGWHMGKKHEAISSPNLLYAFLDF